jgi:hypothetical protein
MKRIKYILHPNPLFSKLVCKAKINFMMRLKTFQEINLRNTINKEYKKKLNAQFSFLIKKNIIFKESRFRLFFYKLYSYQKFYKFLKSLLFITILVVMGFFLYQEYRERIKIQFDKLVKSLIISKICKNEFIINKIAYEILFLVRRESIKRQMSDLILIDVLPNKDIRSDLYRIIKREILSYLKSEDCRRELKILIVKDVMRNEEVRNELWGLIKSFIILKELNFLEDKLEKILVDILSIEAIHSHVAKKIKNEVNKALKDEEMIKLAVKVLSEKFGS